ncbi:MAG: hypothetical protein IBX43_02135 [Campylobacterales bacterium]|nr:hypothetical protein [Campylobacterales bacterium]
MTAHLNTQVENSEEVKTKMRQIVEDTHKAIEGSATNMGLSAELINAIKAIK